VKKIASSFLYSTKQGQQTLNSLGLKSFGLHKIEAFDIMLGNWVEDPQKLKKSLSSFFKGSLSKKRYEKKGKN
jgi:hypothetical protein